MEKYNRLASLFLDLTIDGPIEIPAEFLNVKFPVWTMKSGGNGRTESVYAHVDGCKLLEHFRTNHYTVNTYGEFVEGDGFVNPMLVVGTSKPTGGNIFLETKTLAEIASYCFKNNLGIGIVGNEAGLHLAINTFLLPALSAIYDVVQSEARKKFLSSSVGCELECEVDSQVNEFLTSFSSFLDSIDYANMEIGGENRLIFYLNFKESLTGDDMDLVMMELVKTLEKGNVRCHVSFNVGEPELTNQSISRLTPNSFEAEFYRFFGPNQN